MNKDVSLGIKVMGCALILLGLFFFYLVYIFQIPESGFMPAGRAISWVLEGIRAQILFCQERGCTLRMIFGLLITIFRAILVLLFPLAAIVMGVGLLRYKAWARKCLLYASAIYGIYALQRSYIFALPIIAICIFTIYFLTRSEVKERFK